MRFLLDENVPFDLLNALVDRDHEVSHVAQTQAAAEDPDVLARAVRENAVLVTFDSDFGELIFYERKAPPLGIIYVQSRPDGAMKAVRALISVLDSGLIEPERQFIVIDEGGGLRTLPLA